MYGNRLGRTISAVIFLAAIALALWLQAQLAVTPPTALSLDPQNLAALSPPAPAEPMVDQSAAGDAGPSYLSAVASWADASAACDEFARNPAGLPPAPIQLLLDAVHKSSAVIFAGDPSQIVDYQADHPALENLFELGRTADRAALMLRTAKKVDLARTYFQAVYALGGKLYNERLCYDEYLKGLGLLNEATIGLSECEPAGSPRRAQLEVQEAAMAAYDQSHVAPIYDCLSSADQQVIADHAGDVFRFAAVAGERMFRVEAILKLGRYRFDAARKADQLAAPRRLRDLAGDRDPVIQAAARAALGLTIEQYRTIH